jgi:hypothetical protein
VTCDDWTDWRRGATAHVKAHADAGVAGAAGPAGGGAGAVAAQPPPALARHAPQPAAEPEPAVAPQQQAQPLAPQHPEHLEALAGRQLEQRQPRHGAAQPPTPDQPGAGARDDDAAAGAAAAAQDGQRRPAPGATRAAAADAHDARGRRRHQSGAGRARNDDLAGAAVPGVFAAGAARAHLPAEDFTGHRGGAAHRRTQCGDLRGVRGRVRSDAGPVRAHPVAQPVLPASVCHSVPLRGETGQDAARWREVSSMRRA